MMASDRTVTGPINLGNPGEFTIAELADLVVEMTGTRSKIVFRPLPADDPRQRRPDITRARETLGWAPRVQLRQGLALTISYFESVLGRRRGASRQHSAPSELAK